MMKFGLNLQLQLVVQDSCSGTPPANVQYL
jgi:hypothetical protein